MDVKQEIKQKIALSKNKQTLFEFYSSYSRFWGIQSSGKICMVQVFSLDALYMSLFMRKLAFCLCKNKGADQLRGHREADQRLGFGTRIVQSLYFLNQKFQASSHLLLLYSPVLSDLVGNPEDRFSHNEALIFFFFRSFFYPGQLLWILVGDKDQSQGQMLNLED